MRVSDGTLFFMFLAGVGGVAGTGAAAMGAALDVPGLALCGVVCALPCAAALATALVAARARVAGTDDRTSEGRVMNAIEMLREDHVKLHALFLACARAADAEDRQAWYRGILRALEVHEMIEEEVFYPALQEHERTRDLALDARVAHGPTEAALDELGRLEPHDALWPVRFAAFRALVEEHIEAERLMLERAGEAMSSRLLDDIGGEMEARRRETLQEAA